MMTQIQDDRQLRCPAWAPPVLLGQYVLASSQIVEPTSICSLREQIHNSFPLRLLGDIRAKEVEIAGSPGLAFAV